MPTCTLRPCRHHLALSKDRDRCNVECTLMQEFCYILCNYGRLASFLREKCPLRVCYGTPESTPMGYWIKTKSRSLVQNDFAGSSKHKRYSSQRLVHRLPALTRHNSTTTNPLTLSHRRELLEPELCGVHRAQLAETLTSITSTDVQKVTHDRISLSCINHLEKRVRCDLYRGAVKIGG